MFMPLDQAQKNKEIPTGKTETPSAKAGAKVRMGFLSLTL